MPCRPVDRWFQVKDVGVNSVYAAGWSVLQHLALAINDTATAELCASEAATSAAAIISKMYVPALDGFRSLYVDWDGQEKISTPNVIQNLFPLLLPVLPQNFVAKLVEEVLKKKVPCSHLIFIRFTGSQQQQIQQYLCSSHCSAG